MGFWNFCLATEDTEFTDNYFLATEFTPAVLLRITKRGGRQSTQSFSDTDCAVFVQLDVLDKSCFLSKLIRSIYLRPLTRLCLIATAGKIPLGFSFKLNK